MPDLSVAFPPTLTGIALDPNQGLSKQLYALLRQQVLDGRLSSGTRLPASRDLAHSLGISRNSVIRAYDQLYAEGFIEGRVGDGTYVAQLSEPGTAPRRTARKNYPPTYPQVYPQVYTQVCPQSGLKCRQIPPVKLSTARCKRCWKTSSA